MGDQNTHLRQATRNAGTIDFLLAEAEDHVEWVVAIAFYTALHFIEAMFQHFGAELHCHSHRDRRLRLAFFANGNKEIKIIYRRYRRLARAADIARYLEQRPDKNPDDSAIQYYKTFGGYMSVTDVQAKLLDDCLATIQDKVGNIITKKKRNPSK